MPIFSYSLSFPSQSLPVIIFALWIPSSFVLQLLLFSKSISPRSLTQSLLTLIHQASEPYHHCPSHKGKLESSARNFW